MRSKLHNHSCNQIAKIYNINPESTLSTIKFSVGQIQLSLFIMNRMSPVIPLFQWFSLTFIYISPENLF